MVTADMLVDIPCAGECAGLWERLAEVPFIERRKGCNMGFTGFRPNVTDSFRRRAVELEYESQEMQSQGFYHVSSALFLAAAALRRGDESGAEIWQDTASQELAAVQAHEAAQVAVGV